MDMTLKNFITATVTFHVRLYVSNDKNRLVWCTIPEGTLIAETMIENELDESLIDKAIGDLVEAQHDESEVTVYCNNKKKRLLFKHQPEGDVK
jgi:hypothetical protein